MVVMDSLGQLKIWLAFVALSLSGCSTSPDGPTTVLPDLDLVGEASETQKPALADGVVTEAEYEAAVIATLACLEEEGVPALGPVWTDDRRRLEFAYTSGDLSSSFADEAWERCWIEHLDNIALTWHAQHALTPQERTVAIEEYRQCLHNYQVPGAEPGASEQQILFALGEIVDTADPVLVGSIMRDCMPLNPNAQFSDQALPEFKGPGAG